MRFLTGLALASGLLLVQAGVARAQGNDVNAFGAYPAGITNGSPSPYGMYSSGYYTERMGYPFTYTYQSAPIYGSAMSVPGAGQYYTSGYSGYVYPGVSPYATTYSYPGTHLYSYPSAASYGYTTGYAYPTWGYSRGGLFGRRWNRWAW